MSTSTPEVVSCGVDWLTFTCSRTHRHADSMRAAFDTLMKLEAKAGNEIKAQKRARYEGIGTSGLFYGERDDRLMFDASSDLAESMIRRVMQYGDTIRATRIDAQTTVRQAENTPPIAERLPGAYKASHATHGRRTPPHTVIHSDGAGGDSYTVGAASSLRRLVIYNKSVEAGGRLGPNLERFELRCRQEAAGLLYEDILRAGHTFQPCFRHVTAECQHYGIEEPWQTARVARAKISIKRQSDREKWELWLSDVVAPVVLKLRAVGASDAEIADLLGLSPLRSRAKRHKS